MKKIFIGLALLVFSSCSYMQGDYTLGARNTFNDNFYTYAIDFYEMDEAENVVKETKTVNNYKVGVLKYATPGTIIASSKLVQKEVFSNEFVRPNMKGALVSYTVPVEFSDEKVYRTIGETKIKGRVYRLVDPNRLGDVVLLDDAGNIYPRVGRIYNNRLALLQTSFLLEPEGLKFKDDTTSHVEGDGVISGFEIRYLGLQDNYMLFDFMTIEPDGSTMIEEHKTYKFLATDKMISFNGIQIEIQNVSNDGIEYKILNV